MKRLLPLLVVATALLGVLAPADRAAAHDPPICNGDCEGDGSVRLSRLPWLEGETRELRTGWLGGTHGNQYATDWGNFGATFKVYAASEGPATCNLQPGGWGFRVDVTRNDGIVEYYAHLRDPCPWGSTHLEQGDFVWWADETGVPGRGIHLHYEVIGTTNNNQRCLSQFCDFLHSVWHHSPHHTFVADNAGPGVGAPEPERGLLWLGYSLGGHNAPDCLPGEKAWQCYGSSMAWGYGSPKAFHWAHGSPLDWAWHQAFQAADGIWHGINLPDDCSSVNDYAYVVPDDYFWKWFNNADQLGQPRSSVIAAGGGWYIQYFRYGVIYSFGYGKNAIVVPNSPTDACFA